MIVKILGSSSKAFNAVQYLDNKMDIGKGEVTLLKNFPAHISHASSQQEVKDYFRAISGMGKTGKPQFHAVVSTEGRNHSKAELTAIADRFMKKMGYGEQPYLVVFHNDTDHNHVHVVSARVDRNTHKRIDDSFERLRAQTALRQVMKEMYGLDHGKKLDALLSYSYADISQFGQLLKANGYSFFEKEGNLHITHNGAEVRSIARDSLAFRNADQKAGTENGQKTADSVQDMKAGEATGTDGADKRKRQLKAILNKYKNEYSNKVFRVEDARTGKATYHSELQQALKAKFGIEIVFSHSGDKKPFGYTIIDNKTKNVFKGGEVEKMNAIFDLASGKIDKKLFEVLANCNRCEGAAAAALKKHLEHKFGTDIEDYMFTGMNSRITYDVYSKMKDMAIAHINGVGDAQEIAREIAIVKNQGQYFVFSESECKIVDLRHLVGERNYALFLQNQSTPNHSDPKENADNERRDFSDSREQPGAAPLMEMKASGSSGAEDSENPNLRNKRKKGRKR